MIKSIRENRGITLIALVITIVILIILAAVAINTVLGENGILARAKQAALMQKKAQCFEDINIEIMEEQTERQIEAKEDAFIVSINERLVGQQQASNQTTNSHTKKSWIKNTLLCDTEKNMHDNPYDNNMIIIYTTYGYEVCVVVDNINLIANIQEDSFKEEEDACTVIYNSNQGTGSVESQTVIPGFKVNLRQNTFTRNNYTFAGWSKNSNGSGEIYLAGSDLKITEDTTLYAVWTLNSVTITYDANTGSGEMECSEVIIGFESQLPLNTFTKEGYVFSKWTTNANGTGDEYANNSNITINEDITLYAQWSLETYTITYALNEGTITGQKTSYTIEDAAFTLPTPTKNGYSFTGWTGTGLNSSTLSVTVPSGSTGNRAYTANWISIYERDYTPVEYLQSDGSQVIDTGINPSGMQLGVDITFQYLELTHDTWFFGELQWENGDIGCYELGIYSGYFDFIMSKYDKTYLILSQSPQDTNKHNLKFNISGYGSSLDNVALSTTVSGGNMSGNAIDTALYTIYIFGRKGNADHRPKIRIYDCKIYNGTSLIRDYATCVRKSDGKPGLYDKKTFEFYVNQGSGEFTTP